MSRIPQSESSRPASSASSFSWLSHRSSRPQSVAPTHPLVPSTDSHSSTVRGSIYSQDEHDEKDLLLRTEDEKDLKYYGEQIWEPQSQTRAAGGQREATIHRRGCMMPRASLDEEARWQRNVKDIIGYEFRNIDLLEEALESQGSGVTVTGQFASKRETNRNFSNGNQELAKVGEAAMVLVLMDQCYLFRLSKEDTEATIKRHTNRVALYQIGKATKLFQYIRPHAPIPASQSRNIWGNVKHEVKSLGGDAVREISFGIKAIIGAVYFDGGYESARRVMARLGLIIKLPKQ